MVIPSFVDSIDDGAITGISKRELKQMVADGFERMGIRWHDDFRPGHFSLAAMSKYGYTPRSPGYNKRKRRELGHTIPLVKSGRSRDLSRQRNVTKNSKGARVSMPIRQFNARAKNSKINMRAEFLAETKQESLQLEKEMGDYLEKRISTFRRTTRKRL